MSAAGGVADVTQAAAAVTVMGMPLDDFVTRCVILGVAVVVALVVQRVLVKLARAALERSEIPSASIFLNILRVLIWSFALLSVMKPVFNTEPTVVVTALGVVSVAVSLGMQDTVSNVVAGFGLMLGHVVKPGDNITVGSITGTVTDVTWRSTTVRSRGGNVEVIPNSVLNKTSLTHLTDWSAGVCSVGFAVAPGADLDAVAADVLARVHAAAGELLDPAVAPDVVFTELTAYGTTGQVRLHAVDGVTFSAVQDRVTRAIQGADWLANAL